ncbi:hypothetical protein [Nocardioides sp. NPDC004968]|uniref:hypothetical protein n=1 Tax=Nocardioides sp. NPDC004968 TaxID=3155894 RepID=UPI0033B610FF
MTTPTPLRIRPLAEARRREVERRARLRRLAALNAGNDLAWRLERSEDASLTPADLPPGATRDFLQTLMDGKPQRRTVGAIVGIW